MITVSKKTMEITEHITGDLQRAKSSPPPPHPPSSPPRTLSNSQPPTTAGVVIVAVVVTGFGDIALFSSSSKGIKESNGHNNQLVPADDVH